MPSSAVFFAYNYEVENVLKYTHDLKQSDFHVGKDLYRNLCSQLYKVKMT
jgi:hypothetical protein